jgi:hypothetical protein
LIKKGVKIDIENQDGNTPLALAFLSNNAAPHCIALIEAGADVNKMINQNQKPTTKQQDNHNNGRG